MSQYSILMNNRSFHNLTLDTTNTDPTFDKYISSGFELMNGLNSFELVDGDTVTGVVKRVMAGEVDDPNLIFSMLKSPGIQSSPLGPIDFEASSDLGDPRVLRAGPPIITVINNPLQPGAIAFLLTDRTAIWHSIDLVTPLLELDFTNGTTYTLNVIGMRRDTDGNVRIASGDAPWVVHLTQAAVADEQFTMTIEINESTNAGERGHLRFDAQPASAIYEIHEIEVRRNNPFPELIQQDPTSRPSDIREIPNEADLTDIFPTDKWNHVDIELVEEDQYQIIVKLSRSEPTRYVKRTTNVPGRPDNGDPDPDPGAGEEPYDPGADPTNAESWMMLRLSDGRTINCLNREHVDRLASADPADSTITIRGVSFRKDEIVHAWFGPVWNTGDYANWEFRNLPNNFLRNMTNLRFINAVPSLITQIGNNFLMNCHALNCPIHIPYGVATIATDFLANCHSLNQPVIIADSVRYIHARFMHNCTSYNRPITLPASLQNMGSHFMNNCTAFNALLDFGRIISFYQIQGQFLMGCTSFNRTLRIENVTHILDDFMRDCTLFNSTLYLPTSLLEIGINFLRGCTGLTQSLDISMIVNRVGNQFMRDCSSFRGDLIVGNAFVAQGPSDNDSLAMTTDGVPAFTQGITIRGLTPAQITTVSTRLPDRLTSTPFRRLHFIPN